MKIWKKIKKAHKRRKWEIENQRLIELENLNGLKSFLTRFREKYISCDLIRIGGDADGGYLLPDNLQDVSYCFSPGVDYTAKFEQELSTRYNIKSFMADASVEKSPIQDENFEFIPKFLGAISKNEFITLSDWIDQTIGEKKAGKILQMDIEGGEYDVLIYEDDKTLASFSSLVIEFHDLNKLFNRDFRIMLSAVFEKIYRNFSICHVHPNNCCGLAEFGGVYVPRVMEVTFIRNDLLPKYANGKKVHLPHALDRPNLTNDEDIQMPEQWWKDPR